MLQPFLFTSTLQRLSLDGGEGKWKNRKPMYYIELQGWGVNSRSEVHNG